jgi:DNA-binding NarL/FixJ family response regulator
VLSAIVAGASGYLLKQVRARDLVSALESVGRGESLLDPAVTEKVLERIRGSRATRRRTSCRS